MGRNFFGRIELCFPVLDRRIKERVIQEGLKPYLSDNSQVWEMDSEGNYRRKKSRGRIPRSAQDHLLGMLAADK
jgi:polyphosphate kinase